MYLGTSQDVPGCVDTCTVRLEIGIRGGKKKRGGFGLGPGVKTVKTVFSTFMGTPCMEKEKVGRGVNSVTKS